MSDFNKVILMGRVGVTPEKKVLDDGTVMAKFTLAVAYHKSKEPKESVTQWHNIVAWEHCAETCLKGIKRGDTVMLEGRLVIHDWKDKQEVKRTKVEIHASNVRFLGRRSASAKEIGAAGPVMPLLNGHDAHFTEINMQA